MSDSAHDAELGRLIIELGALMRKHGAKTEPVRQFIRANLHVPEFKGIAITLVLLGQEYYAREAERKLLGKGPMCGPCLGEGFVESEACETCGGSGDASGCDEGQ